MSWPDDGIGLWAELERFAGRLAVVVGDPAPAIVLAQLAGAEPCPVGARLSSYDHPPSPTEVMDLLAGERVLIDLDVLFSPLLALDPPRLLRDLSRQSRGVVALWPGEVTGKRATYSRHGRADHHLSELSDTLVLRARTTHFPDETPFTVERIL